MIDIFKTVLMLSLLGAGLTALLLILKPITAKRLPARWQYYIWLCVIVCMAVPVWKWIPQRSAAQITPYTVQKKQGQTAQTQQLPMEAVIIENTPIEYREISITPGKKILIYDLFAYIWLAGTCVFLCAALISYWRFLYRKKKTSVCVPYNAAVDSVLKEKNIKRHIRIRLSGEAASPMLVGILRPVIYLPAGETAQERLRMILLHELTHYKRGDLIYKWISLFVNAVHWFNPLAYILSANVHEACEVSCDMAVTKNMERREQDLYMKTILDLVQEETGGKKDV